MLQKTFKIQFVLPVVAVLALFTAHGAFAMDADDEVPSNTQAGAVAAAKCTTGKCFKQVKDGQFNIRSEAETLQVIDSILKTAKSEDASGTKK